MASFKLAIYSIMAQPIKQKRESVPYSSRNLNACGGVIRSRTSNADSTLYMQIPRFIPSIAWNEPFRYTHTCGAYRYFILDFDLETATFLRLPRTKRRYTLSSIQYVTAFHHLQTIPIKIGTIIWLWNSYRKITKNINIS